MQTTYLSKRNLRWQALRLLSMAVLVAIYCNTTGARGQDHVAVKKLIEFGWDEPDTEFLRKHIDKMETTPFDGTVFHVNYATRDSRSGVFSFEAWGKRKFSEDDLRRAIEDLRATRFQHFQHNFLRFNVTPADLDWFDDFSSIISNARLAGKVARLGQAKGIMLDTEAYAKPLFSYRRQAGASRKSWQQYARQAERRGREVMQAFQRHYPGIQIFLTFGYELPWLKCAAVGRLLADCEYGLLVPFLDGMVAAAKGPTRIIGGYEFAYYFRQPEEFAEANFIADQVVQMLAADPTKFRRTFHTSFGIWLDSMSPELGWNQLAPEKNFHTPAQFQEKVRAALAMADEYVWIYSEIPRWWSEPNGEPKDLPSPYEAALRAAKQLAGR